jgi:hypothetical protein
VAKWANWVRAHNWTDTDSDFYMTTRHVKEDGLCRACRTE